MQHIETNLIYVSPHFSLGNGELEAPEIEMGKLQLFLTCHGTQSFYKLEPLQFKLEPPF